jgi:hypothetical protein
MYMEGIPENYGRIMLFNVIIIYHKRINQRDLRRGASGVSRAKDGQPYEHARSYG